MNAELTIIAAAGSDSNYGLPGVGHQKRKPPYLTTCTRIGKHFLITTTNTPTTSITEQNGILEVGHFRRLYSLEGDWCSPKSKCILNVTACAAASHSSFHSITCIEKTNKDSKRGSAKMVWLELFRRELEGRILKLCAGSKSTRSGRLQIQTIF
jgi:hypothetical protein